MHIEYDTTFDEIVDTHLRIHSRSKVFRRAIRRNVLSVCLMVAVGSFLFISEPLFVRTTIAVIAAAFGGLFTFLSYPWWNKRFVRKYLREQLGSQGPFKFEMELRDEEIWTKMESTQLLFDWKNVLEILDKPDAVEFYVKNGGFIIVRNRGFKSSEERSQFLCRARERVAAHQ
ncbi:YcxB family protein [Candidatus Hydrogenedentota bacterium]